MRLIDTTPFDIKLMDIPGWTEDYKQGYIDGTRHVLEEMDEAPTVDAVPLDMLCGWLSKHVGNPPCPCGYDLKGISCNPDWTRKECWHNCLTNWLEGQNARHTKRN